MERIRELAGLRTSRFSPATCVLKRPYAIVIAAMAVAALIWSYGLGHDQFWIDERASVVFANLSFAQIVDRSLDPAHPPTYSVVLKGWISAVGDSDAWVRFLSVLFMAGTLPVVYAMARQVGTHRVAVTAMAIFASTPFIFWYAQEARSYAMLTFFASLSCLFVLLIVGGGGDKETLRKHVLYVCGFAVCLAVTLGVHYGAILLVPFLVLCYLFAFYRKASPRLLIVAFGGIVLTVAVYAVVFMPYLLLGLDEAHATLIPFTRLGHVRQAIYLYGGGKWMPLAGVFALTGVFCGMLVWVRSRNWEHAAFFSSVCFAPVALYLLVTLADPGFMPHPKALVFIFPPLSVLIAYGLQRLGGKGAWAVLSMLLICNVIGMGIVVAIEKGPPWRDAAQLINEKHLDNAVAVICPYQYIQAKAYLPEDAVFIQPNWDGSPDSYPRTDKDGWATMNEIPARYDDVWLVQVKRDVCSAPPAWGTMSERYELRNDSGKIVLERYLQ